MQFSCSCGKTLKIADNLSGKKIRCPACKEVVRVPEEEVEEAIEAVELPPSKSKPRLRPQVNDDEESPPPRRRSRPVVDEEDEEEMPPPRKKRRPVDEDDDDDRPRKKKTKTASFWSRYGLWVGIGGGGLVAAAAIVVVIILMSGGGDGDTKGLPVGQNMWKGDGAKDQGKGGPASFEEATARPRSMNNLRQLGLAMHAYHDVKRSLPPADGSDVTGKGELNGLSWRVHLLPYVEKDQFYLGLKQGKYPPVNASEPWNRPELAKLGGLNLFDAPMPGKAKESWHTFYRVFVGPGAAFEKGKKISLGAFPDGLAKTLMIVEAAEAVPWPKPEELIYDPAKPLPKLGGLWKDGFYGVFADGSLHFIPRNTDEKILRGYITRNGGEDVPFPDELPR